MAVLDAILLYGLQFDNHKGIDMLLQDIRLSLRTLFKNPGFSIVAVMTLALGIGASAAMFSVINAVLLRPLPYENADRLAAITTTDITRNNQISPISYPVFLDWRSQSRSFESLTAWHLDDFTLVTASDSVHVIGGITSANLLSTLGVAPIRGRGFSADEDQPGSNSLPVILSHKLWQEQFGSDPGIVGRPINLNGQSFAVIGIMPSGFQFPVQSDPVDFWTTIALYAQPTATGPPLISQRGVSFLDVVGRLKPGISIQQGQVELNGIQQALNKAYPENRPRTVTVTSEIDRVVGDMRAPLLFLFGAVTLVLMIACANVANLLLVRSTSRHREIAVRFALGATRTSVARQLLTESVVLAVIGGLVGLLLADFAHGLMRLTPKALGRVADAQIDFRVLGFTLLVAVLTGLIFGMFPVAQNWRGHLTASLNESSRGGTVGQRHTQMRSSIIVGEVALAMVLLSGAGLLLQSLVRLLRVDPGFASDHTITFGINLPPVYAGPQRVVFYDRLLEHIRTLPGVKSASVVRGLPLGSDEDQISSTFEIVGHPVAESERPMTPVRVSSPSYMQTMRIRLIAGRDFTQRDDDKAPPVVIINQTLARNFFGGQNPIGQRLLLTYNFANGTPTREIVGVVGDVKYSGLGTASAPEVYLPESQVMTGIMTVVVRTVGEPDSLVPELRSAVRSLDKQVPLRDIKTLDDYVSDSVATPRFDTLLLGIFAAVALFLTSVGLYGVVSYSVAQRTREIGIRVALGAQRRDISRMVIRQGILLGIIGVVAGLAGAFALRHMIASWLYGVGPADISVLIGIAFLLIAIAFCASYAPAIRATKVDPIIALRDE
jgi:putative ABC transport system permease protein